MKTRLVLVDDSQVDLSWFNIIATHAGYEVSTFEHPLTLVDVIQNQHPNLVLLDVKMPALDGDKVCKILKENAATKNVKVVLYSSMAASKLSDLARDCNADGYIVKSSDAGNVMRQVHQYCAA
jgi:DNA-binding response OmpR family regulator